MRVASRHPDQETEVPSEARLAYAEGPPEGGDRRRLPTAQRSRTGGPAGPASPAAARPRAPAAPSRPRAAARQDRIRAATDIALTAVDCARRLRGASPDDGYDRIRDFLRGGFPILVESILSHYDQIRETRSSAK